MLNLSFEFNAKKHNLLSLYKVRFLCLGFLKRHGFEIPICELNAQPL